MLIYRLESLEADNRLSFFLHNLVYGRLGSQPGDRFGTDSTSNAKDCQSPGFGLSIQTFQVQEGALVIGRLFVMERMIIHNL